MGRSVLRSGNARSGSNLAPIDTSDQPRELRPIAGALAQTQRLIVEQRDVRDRRRTRELEATLKRLASLAEKLMQLSRVDAGVGLGAEDVDLIAVLDLVVDDSAKRLEEPDRLIYVKPDGVRLLARMDMDAFAIAVRNLIDNALNHGPSEGRVEVRVERHGIIRVINGGPSIAPEVLAGLKNRFARGETRHAGSGLGLAIVETIMNQTGGMLELFSPAARPRRRF